MWAHSPTWDHLIPSPLPQIEPPSRPDSCRAAPAPILIAPSAPVMSLRPRPHPPPALLLISSRATAFGHAHDLCSASPSPSASTPTTTSPFASDSGHDLTPASASCRAPASSHSPASTSRALVRWQPRSVARAPTLLPEQIPQFPAHLRHGLT
jgi:hypothetical protein